MGPPAQSQYGTNACGFVTIDATVVPFEETFFNANSTSKRPVACIGLASRCRSDQTWHVVSDSHHALGRACCNPSRTRQRALVVFQSGQNLTAHRQSCARAQSGCLDRRGHDWLDGPNRVGRRTNRSTKRCKATPGNQTHPRQPRSGGHTPFTWRSRPLPRGGDEG